ncbi:hypothetical protein F441_20364 [Phytophthora nicotianae CJ01A1]|uniref:Uncharacterized protein n=1 Tax=Phytophthora nicotianae CJ01A1 TaxID=1317063 RepID=W2VXW8_PHYNI|nr:hypothetical protein F441_20364 [Phytophthora nicotianae CJ01A1]
MQLKVMVLQGEAVQALTKEANRQGGSRSSARCVLFVLNERFNMYIHLQHNSRCADSAIWGSTGSSTFGL